MNKMHLGENYAKSFSLKKWQNIPYKCNEQKKQNCKEFELRMC